MNVPPELQKAGWSMERSQLTKQYAFKDFIHAMHFVNKVAALAEETQHHPDILVQYNHVTIKTWTHDAGNKVTEKDVALAKAIESVH
jgi:4a-hydroxytetrahydrobiopterin dehydratase